MLVRAIGITQSAAPEGWYRSASWPWPYPLTWRTRSERTRQNPRFADAYFAPESESAMILVEGNARMVEPYLFEEGVGRLLSGVLQEWWVLTRRRSSAPCPTPTDPSAEKRLATCRRPPAPIRKCP